MHCNAIEVNWMQMQSNAIKCNAMEGNAVQESPRRRRQSSVNPPTGNTPPERPSLTVRFNSFTRSRADAGQKWCLINLKSAIICEPITNLTTMWDVPLIWHNIVNWYVKSLHTDHLLLSFTWFLTNQNHTSASLKMISKDLHRTWNHWLHSTCEDRLKLDKKFDLNRVQSPTLRSAATLCQSSELDAPLQLQAVNFFDLVPNWAACCSQLGDSCPHVWLCAYLGLGAIFCQVLSSSIWSLV